MKSRADFGFGPPLPGSGANGASPGNYGDSFGHPPPGLNAFKSNGNLREGYSATVGRRTVATGGAAGLQVGLND